MSRWQFLLDEIRHGGSDVPPSIETTRLAVRVDDALEWAPGVVRRRWKIGPWAHNPDGMVFGGLIAETEIRRHDGKVAAHGRTTVAAWTLGALLLGLGAVGCNSYTVELEAPETLASGHLLRVGAAREEITPVPGLPMGGYGFVGKTARGFWTRLWANAIMIEDPSGAPLVLVSCDLWSMPAGLADEVVARVQADPRGRGIGREHVLIVATHTHQSPGAYSSSVGYNAMASPAPGYDPALFDFLARRISRAILRAAASRAGATMLWRDGPLTGFVRNRALAAFRRNPETETDAFLGRGSGLPLCDLRTPVADRAACRAVDPTVTVVRFERHDEVVAAAVFTAFHPTAAGPDLALYSSDVFGVAGMHAGHQLGGSGGAAPPVLAFVNGAEGDVSPNWRAQDGRNVLALGRRLGERVVELARGGAAEEEVTIGHAFARTPIADVCLTDTRCTARRPIIGRGTLAGASDGRTHLLSWLFRGGVTRTPLTAQGVKVPALDPGIGWLRLPLTALLMLPVRGPTGAPLGVYRLGPLAIATLPGEFTTMMGRRIARAVAAALPSVERVLLAGLANAYLSYFTTPEEYAAQLYEGSSTLYGPQAGPVVAAALGRLAASVARGDRRPALGRETLQYTPGPARRFGITDVEPAHVSDEGLHRLLRDPPWEIDGPTYPSICWRGTAPTFPDVRLPYARAEIHAEDRDRWEALPFADNLGARFITVASPHAEGAADWRALWMPPPNLSAGARLRLVVEPVEGPPITGAPFTIDGDESLSVCTPR